jgi:hypothetical protein
MRIQIVATMVAALLLFPRWPGAQVVASSDVVQTTVTSLVTMLESSEVGRVEILSIPARIITRIPVTPEGIEKGFHYKLTVRDLRGGLYQDELTKAVKTVYVAPVDRNPDLRWALIFYDTVGVRVTGLYFDSSGRIGTVDEAPVSFRGNLFEWLNARFSKAMP